MGNDEENENVMYVRDLMTDDPIVVAPDVTLEHVMALMQKASIRHVPVVDENGILGVVSDTDLQFIHSMPGVFKEIASDDIKDALAVPVGVIMKSRFLIERDVLTVDGNAPLKEAVNLLLGGGIRALPVVDDNQDVVGVLSSVDILRWLAEEVL